MTTNEVTMAQRVSLITLGVRDMEKTAKFYRDLGWRQVASPDEVIAFDLIGQTLGLYPLQALAEDIGVSIEELGYGGITLAHNVPEKQDVDLLLNLAKAAGANILKPASEVFWGGYHGYFADPEGQIWEVAYNPLSKLSGNGEFRWNGY